MPREQKSFGEQMKLIGHIKVVLMIGGKEQPLNGPIAAEYLASALVDIVDQMEPLKPHLSAPVIERVERIYHHVHRLIENQFQQRWHQKKFER
jgi:hypothetical protein